MKLIVAEKASVARNIAAALGAKRTDNCWTCTDYIITNCVGHLCALAMPQDYDPSLERWKLETLPILPEEYRFKVTSEGKKQFAIVKKLMADKRVTSIINACDGDREGENIFRLVYRMAGCRKSVERLWISSMEEPAIAAGMKNLRPMSDYDHLAEAAECREIADWVIGINFSRLYSLLYDAQLTVGRVQTPTVNMVVERELEIQSFVPADYFIITADFGTFSASLRCDSPAKAQEVMERCKGSEGVVSMVVSVEKSTRQPMLYNLSALEQDCNRLFGATPAQTDAALQQLYENRMATYPRTDSTYLTEKDREMAEEVLHSFLSSGMVPKAVCPAAPKLDAVINDKKVSGHPALLPTAGAVEHLSEVSSLERQILLLLMFRLLEAVSPPRAATNTKAEILLAGYSFTAKGIVEKNRGWKAVEDEKFRCMGVQKKANAQSVLPDLSQRQSVSIPKLKCEKKQTKPPERFTEADLLHCMEHCGQSLEDEEQREALKGCGIGTPATRAQVIENVIWTKKNPRGLLTRGTKVGNVWKDKKHLYPTEAAMTFMKLLPEQLKTPAMTGSWEHQLSQIADGMYDPMLFRSSIENYVSQMVETSRQYHRPDDTPIFGKETVMSKNIICTCPICKKSSIVSSRHRGRGTSKIVYHCADQNCSMRMGSPIAGREITDEEVRQLCKDGVTGWMDGFVSRQGRPFSAKLHIVVEDGRADVKFMQVADMAICDCPVCSTGRIIPFHWVKEDGSMVEGWRCTNGECKLKRFYTPKNDFDFVDREIVELFTTGQFAVPSGMKDRKGNPISGTLFMEKDDSGALTGKVVFVKRKENAA